jgi:hypothetical protein
LTLAADPADDQDTLYLGLYNQADDLADILEDAGVTLVIDPAIEEDPEENGAEDEEQVRRIESDLGNLQMAGNTLILLNESGGQRHVVVLAASSAGLENATGRLIDLIPLNADYALADCLLDGGLAICPSAVPNEAVEFELVTDGVPETTSSDPDTNGGGNGSAGAFDAVPQGPIALGESVSGVLDVDEAHSWSFSDGPATVDIILSSGEDMDGVLELYDPEGNLQAEMDSTFAGDEERLLAIDIPDSGEYTIVVRDFFDEGGDYSLSVDVAGPQDPSYDFDATPQGILPFGETVSGDLDADELHSWSISIDSPTTVNLTLESDPDMDVVLVVLGPDNEPLAIIDDNVAGDGEQALDLELPDAGEYAVIVGEFFGEAGSYTLLLEASSSASNPGLPLTHFSAYLFSVDNGPGNSTILYFGSVDKPYNKN